jgi:WS/DGAT/MGAT family acyltransferase
MALFKLRPASETPLGGPVGPHRIFEWTTLPLEEVKEMRRAAGCKLNDVVLAIVAGAVREFMKRRGVRPEKLDFRVSTPVDVRRAEERSRISGNRVSSWVLRLPLGETDPLARLSAIRRETQALKDSHQAEAIELVNAIHEWLPLDVQGFARGTMNTFVTNVPGPPFPLYLCGAELLAIYPQAPLLEGIGLVTGVISYAGRLCWGFNADYDRVPDLDVYVAGVNRSFLELAEALGVRSSGAIEVIREPSSHGASGESVEPAAEAGRRRNGARSTRRAAPAATH